jgi:DNA-binding MarR family transcriptional regulator/GNAT superfamily N-acetyltransferase
MENRMDTIHDIRGFNRFYTKILGLLDRHVLDSGYSLTEARILYELNEMGSCIANTLSAGLDIDKSYLSRILAGFEKNGLVRKEVSGDDSRSHFIELTAKGIAVIQDLADRSNSQIQQLLSPLSDEECGEVRAAMDTVQRCFGKANSITIRPYTEADIDFVILRQIELYEKEYNLTSDIWIAYVTGGVRRLADQFDARKDCMYILEYGGVLSGCIAIAHTGNQTAQIRFFFVDAAVRGMGMGRRLMELAIGFCRERGYEHVFLWTFSRLDAARHLYGKYGFQIIDTKESSEWGETILEERWDLDL